MVVGTLPEVGKFYISDQSLYEAKLYCKEYNDYILNKNSKKIHINSCSAEDKMSNKNRMNVNNTIVNLVNDGYVVCANCKAGIKYDINKINEVIEDIKEAMINAILEEFILIKLHNKLLTVGKH